ncbi:MAG: hypothetical protein R3E31_12660 [Chloroflexota bacterium]
MVAPLSLLIGHSPIADESELARTTLASLYGRFQGVTRLPLPSGQDVLALLSKSIPYDLVLMETTPVDGYPSFVSNSLVGTTIIVDADILSTYTLEALQTLNGRYQPQLISDLIKLGQQQNTPVSREELVAALNGRWQPGAASQPNPILAAAALLFLLQRTAETAVSHRHSLILRYEEPAPVQTPLRTGWWLAQIRPFLLADFFALIFMLIAFLRTDLWRRDGGILFGMSRC